MGTLAACCGCHAGPSPDCNCSCHDKPERPAEPVAALDPAAILERSEAARVKAGQYGYDVLADDVMDLCTDLERAARLLMEVWEWYYTAKRADTSLDELLSQLQPPGGEDG